MNNKRPYKSDKPQPEYLHEIAVPSGGKTYTIGKGQLVSVIRRPGLIAGKYEFTYAEYYADGSLRIHVEGPVSRERRHKVITLADIKQVHIRTGRR
jgi:hypothetical protein